MHDYVIINSANKIFAGSNLFNLMDAARRLRAIALAEQMILNKDPRVCYNGDFDISNSY